MSAPRQKLIAACEQAMTEIIEAMGREDRMGPIPDDVRAILAKSARAIGMRFTAIDCETLAALSMPELVQVIRDEMEPVGRAACADMRAS